MVVKVLAGLAVVVVALVVVIATRPDTFRVERSVEIAAPPERAYSQVIDFHRWATWSPWEKLDPDMKRTYSGAPSGPGAEYAWQGNGKTGEGRMTIQSATASRIDIKLEFLKPFAATNQAVFSFTPTATGTKVTWSMDGKNNFLAKAFHLVMDMDKLVGGDFEKGLAAMKANAERAPKVAGN
ncbi:MAG TPA: SRPBCC family protein [Polyangiaceae bacterium]|nr:SRPBCC family protein [Polyangiaceae bacterium]